MRTSPRRAFTLLEMMIVCAIFAVIALLMFQIFKTSQDTFDMGMAFNAVQEQATKMFQDIERDFKEARFLQAPLGSLRDHTTLVIQCPVDNDGDGTTVDTVGVLPNVNAGEVEWGAKKGIVTIAGLPLYQITAAQTIVLTGQTDKGWYPAGYITYCFEPSETLSEATTKIDYNSDNDITDVFQRGKIIRILLDFNHREVERRAVLHDVVVNDSPSGDWDGHIGSTTGGAATEDPLFKRVDTGQIETGLTAENTVTGTQLTVNLWILKLDHAGHPVMKNMRNRFSVRIYSDADPTTADPFYPSTTQSLVTTP